MQSTGRISIELKSLIAASYDECSSCKSKLPKDIAAYAGYTQHGEVIYVGECCKDKISELASHIYWWWSADKRPDLNIPLWRYMDFAKFVSLLQHKAIYFSRADMLGDKFEGASGIVERQEEWDNFYLEFFREAIRTVPDGSGEKMLAVDVERQAQSLLQSLRDAAQKDRERYFVSCWHAGLEESEALWRLYCPPNTTGVVIKSNVSSLRSALGGTEYIEVGKVHYIDFRKNYAGIHDRIFHKRKNLSHESEVRAVLDRPLIQEQQGVFMPADIRELIHAVVPSPFAPAWFSAVLEATMKQYEIDVPVERSELLSEPFF